MQAYQLLARLKYLTLTGQDEDGDLEFWGTNDQWLSVNKEEQAYEK